jgi:aspartyl protease family protein
MLSTIPYWQELALYAVAAALVFTLLFQLPHVGQVLRGAVSFGILALGLFILLQQAPYQPWLAPLMERAGLNSQSVVGNEVRIRMSPDGHFWVRATINGEETRMLVDSGATVTGLSTETARRAGVRPQVGLTPVFARTANGVVQASPASVDQLNIGSIAAEDLKVVVSPALGGVDILGMNFLTRLAGWRVEGRTMVLTPRTPATEGAS